jgi:hypothetical protein
MSYIVKQRPALLTIATASALPEQMVQSYCQEGGQCHPIHLSFSFRTGAIFYIISYVGLHQRPSISSVDYETTWSFY